MWKRTKGLLVSSSAEGSDPLPVVVLISGGGTNLQAIIDEIRNAGLPIELQAVISNEPDAYGLQRAAEAGIDTCVLDHRDYADRASYDRALAEAIDRFRPGLVVLAGFMRILGPEFVHHYAGRLMNIHPSLLPHYKGLHTHERALANGAKQHGASVHFVTAPLDDGPVIVQASVPVLAHDTAETLQRRVHEQEYRIYPLAIRWFAERRLSVRDGKVMLDGEQRPEQGLVD